MLKSNKAITLIVLIITIIVLLILAGVTINMVLGENGIINKSKTSIAKYENAQENENIVLARYENKIDIESNRESVTIDKAEYDSIITRLNNLENAQIIDEKERVIGEYYGETLYARNIKGTVPMVQDLSSWNIKNIIYYEGTLIKANGTTVAFGSYYGTESNYGSLYISSDKKLYYATGSDSNYNNVPFQITIKYTKNS